LYFAQTERDRPFDLAELYLDVGDDTMIRLLGGQVNTPGFQSGKESSQFLAQAILQRDLYVRAFAFRAAFHVGLPEADDEKSRTDALADIWTPVSTELSDLEGRLKAECGIFEIAKRIAPYCGDARVAELGQTLRREHIIVDLAGNRIRPVTINVYTDDGTLEEPNLFFDPARWSQVYDLQKRTGYVFAARQFVALVGLASKIFFFERWGYAVSSAADRYTKTLSTIKPQWISKLSEQSVIDSLMADVLQRKVTVRTYIRTGDLKLPPGWINEAPDLERQVVEDIRDAIPQGISASDKRAVMETFDGVASFLSAMNEDAAWVGQTDLKERDLQQALLRHFRARTIQVEEGGKIGGGEYDVRVMGRTLIENKIAGATRDPFSVKPDAPYQANRYAIATCQRIFFTLIGYIPIETANVIEQTKSIRVRSLEGIDRTAVEICAVVPYGLPRPSQEKRPTGRPAKSNEGV
jgi:hypothetical protein